MGYIKYGLLAAVLLIVTALILSTPAKESIPEWRPAVVPEETVANEYLFALPTSGVAPLTVNITITPPGDKCKQVMPRPIDLDWGDGNIRHTEIGYCKSQTTQLSHTYTSAGTYTAKLFRLVCLQGISACDDSEEIVFGAVTITVH